MAEYPSYIETTISYMKGYLKGYYDSKATFKKYKATKRDKCDMTDAVCSLQQDHKRAALLWRVKLMQQKLNIWKKTTKSLQLRKMNLQAASTLSRLDCFWA